MRRPKRRRDRVTDRTWSASRSVSDRDARSDLVAFTSLPAETGPLWAPDQLSIWPTEGGRYGVDAVYRGQSGRERANHQVERVRSVGISATVRPSGDGDASIVRLGPLTHRAAWLAIEAFLGRPIDA